MVTLEAIGIDSLEELYSLTSGKTIRVVVEVIGAGCDVSVEVSEESATAFFEEVLGEGFSVFASPYKDILFLRASAEGDDWSDTEFYDSLVPSDAI